MNYPYRENSPPSAEIVAEKTESFFLTYHKALIALLQACVQTLMLFIQIHMDKPELKYGKAIPIVFIFFYIVHYFVLDYKFIH